MTENEKMAVAKALSKMCWANYMGNDVCTFQSCPFDCKYCSEGELDRWLDWMEKDNADRS